MPNDYFDIIKWIHNHKYAIIEVMDLDDRNPKSYLSTRVVPMLNSPEVTINGEPLEQFLINNPDIGED
jgi:hypothetical protein